MDIIALGEALIDFTYSGQSKDNQRLFEQNPGGAVTNMLAAASKCGMKTAYLGKVGTDMHGQFLLETMEKANIDITGVVSTDDYFTTLAFVDINDQGERTFSFARKNSADVMISKEEVNLELLQDTKIFHIGSLSLVSEPCRSATFYAVEKAKESGALITYDPNYRASLWNSEEEAIAQMTSVLPLVDMMKLSDEECTLLTGQADPVEAAKILNEKGISLVCVTLGADGAWVGMGGKGIHAPGFKPSRVADTTGAGDSFFGGFLSQFLKTGKTLDEITLEEARDCAIWGNAVASLCVENRGGMPSMPTQEATQARYDTKSI